MNNRLFPLLSLPTKGDDRSLLNELLGVRQHLSYKGGR